MFEPEPRPNMSDEAQTITRLLREWSAGDVDAMPRLTEAIYGELRRVAGAVLGSQGGAQTMQRTELLHEFYFRLPGLKDIDWQERAQFLSIAAKTMRHILVDHARKRNAAKRGGKADRFTSEPGGFDSKMETDVVAVHDALDKFALEYPRHARVVELRFFGGLTLEETFQVLRADGETISQRTVDRDWIFAKAWLRDAIGPV